ncbi:AAA family ATPase [Lentzea tibetensis]|uniref:AAA family ATPase n=1 Tax=Lentzea tibetensis TaxID=2591470 RepID=A0A563EHB7_9PSEU|nr:BTAD domain-containing putative transcriptional regulator [Lentzea tibetensis]TWP45733.1 AAA family ATPase [Lentzea tibetensis]
MRVRLLGPVDVADEDGARRPVSGLRKKAVLAVLGLHAGEIVSADRVIELVWDGRACGLNTLQAHVSQLRRVIGVGSAITARPPGYLLSLDTDVAEAERLLRAARQTSAPAKSIELLREALALWRGAPLVDVAEVPWLAQQADRLAGLEFEVRRELLAARLRTGEHGQVLPELTDLARQHPFDEQVQGQLVLALYRGGRQADALAVLREVRDRLAAELGIDPGPALRELEESVLRQDGALVPPERAVEVRRTPFAGRTNELSTLDNMERGTVAVAGDPGIGKTRLLTEWAGRTGRLVLWGRASEFEQQVPFAMVADALAEHAPQHLAELSAAERGLLGELLPGLRAAEPAPNGERFHLHRAVRALLENMACAGGVVLVLDDLHWADDGSAELLDYLLRRPPSGPVVLAVSYRPRQLTGRLRHALGRAINDGVVTPIELGPLSPAEIDELLPVRLEGVRRREVHEVARGNPFYVQALAGAAVAAMTPGDEDDDLPAQVRAALAAELDALCPTDELVAKAAAVAADVVEPELVAHMADLGVDEVLGALDTLVRRDVLRQIRGTERFRFRHPLLRRVTYDAAGSGWRAAAHGRAAKALRLRGAPAVERAHHVERSARRGDREAVAVLREAAAGTLHSSPAASVRWLVAAEHLLPDEAETAALRLDLLSMRALALALTGKLRESREAVHELLSLLPAEMSDLRASLVALCAGIERLLGRHAESKAQLVAELARRPERDDRAAAELMLGLAVGHPSDDRRDGVDWPGKALRAARTCGGPLLVGALAAHVVADQALGRTGLAALGKLDEAADLVDAMPDGELSQLLYPIVLLATAETCEERTEAALRHLNRGLAVARSTGQTYVAGEIHTAMAFATGQTGDLDRVSHHLEDARDAAELSGYDQFTAAVCAFQSWVATFRGDLDLALRLGKEAITAGGERNLFAGLVHGPVAFAALRSGDAATCTDLLTAALGHPRSSTVPPMTRVWWYSLLAEAAAAQRLPDVSATWADRAEADLRPWTPPRRRGHTHLARVHAALPTDPARAVDHATRATALFDSVGQPVMGAHARQLLAVSLRARGDAGAARAELTKARALADRCGTSLPLVRQDQLV